MAGDKLNDDMVFIKPATTVVPTPDTSFEAGIDKLEFNADGSMKQVIPTHKGISAVGVIK